MSDIFEFHPDYILRINFRLGRDVKIATFGDERHVNLMGFYLEQSERLTYVILYVLDELKLDEPVIRSEEKTYRSSGPYYYIEYNDFGEPLILSDFEMFLHDGRLTFTFFDTPTADIYESGRFEMGFDDNLDPTYFTVKDINDEEYNNIIRSIQMRRIPITENGRLKTENLLRPVKRGFRLPFGRRKR